MLGVREVRSERSGAGPVLFVLEELLRCRVAQKEAVRSTEETPCTGTPGRVGRLRGLFGGGGGGNI